MAFCPFLLVVSLSPIIYPPVRSHALDYCSIFIANLFSGDMETGCCECPVVVVNDPSEWRLVRCETALPDPHSILPLSQLSPVRTVQGRRQSKEQGKDCDAQGTWLCLWSWCSNGLGGVKIVHALFGTHPNLTQPWVSHPPGCSWPAYSVVFPSLKYSRD